MAALSCLECGAPRDVLDPVCRHCPADATNEPKLALRWRGVLRRARSLVDLTLVVEGQRARSAALPLSWKHVGWAVAAAFSVLAGELLALRAPPQDRFVAWALVTGSMLGPLVAMLEYLSPPEARDPWRERCTCTGTALCLGCRVFYDADAPDWPALDTRAALPDRALGACDRCGGEAEMRGGFARCRHCRAPLLPGGPLLDQAALSQEQHTHELRVASWLAARARHRRAKSLSRWVARAKWLFMLAAVSWVFVALLKGL